MAGSLQQQAGTLAASGSARLLTAGDAAQSAAGTLLASGVQVSAGGANTFGASRAAAITIAPDVVSLAGVLPTFNLPDPAATTVPASLRPASLRLDGQTVTINRQTAADTVLLHAVSGLTEVGAGAIEAGTLTGSASAATLLNPANNILTLSNFQVASSFAVADTPTAGLSLAGSVQADTLAITLSGPQATVALGSGATLRGSTVSLVTPGAIIEALDALIDAGTLSVQAGRLALLAQPGNQIARLGAVRTTADLQLRNAIPLEIDGNVSAGGASLLSLQAPSLDINGGALSGGTVILQASGVTSERAGGTIAAQSLTVAAGQLEAQSAGNSVRTLQSITAPGGVTFAGQGPVQVAGSLRADAGPVALTVAGELQVPGAIAARDGVTLNATGAVQVTGTLSGTSLTIGAGRSAVLAGQETAAKLLVSAPSIALQGGAIQAGGVPQPSGITFANLPTQTAATGAFFEAAASFTQTGITRITPAAGSASATVRIDLTGPGAAITFQSLVAPFGNLILGLGTGRATGGPINVANLAVTFTPGPGSADLFGIVQNQAGTPAAGVSTIAAERNSAYRVNSCAIGSINCVLLSAFTLPISNPLKEISLNFFRDEDEDSDLLVPNITEQGL